MALRLGVMCVRCARIYLYDNQPEARCPRCGWNRWVDPRMLIRDIVGQGQGDPAAAQKQLHEIIWKAVEYVEDEDPKEDVA